MRIALIGEKADLTYTYDYLGAGPESLTEVAARPHTNDEVVKAAHKAQEKIGAGNAPRADGEAVAEPGAGRGGDQRSLKDGQVKFDVIILWLLCLSA